MYGPIWALGPYGPGPIWVCAGNPFVKSCFFLCAHAFRMRSVQTLRKRRNIFLKFMRSRCVPCKPSAKRIKSHSAGMRSYAFRATLPQICKRGMRSYEFRLRSVCVPPYFLKNFQKMDAFLGVPCNSHAIRKHDK